MSHLVVALVASAGGLAAVRAVLDVLPADVHATLLVAIHQEPDRRSRMPDLLATGCALPVRHAEDGEALHPGIVRVAPPGHHLLVTPEERLTLLATGPYPPHRPSADLLLVTMAMGLRDRAVAVVLSGTGHDGATGAAAVHDLGGHVVTADEASSQEYGMPGAAAGRDDAVDRTLDVHQIGAYLGDLARAHLRAS